MPRRRKPLQRRTPLDRSGELRRTPLPRSTLRSGRPQPKSDRRRTGPSRTVWPPPEPAGLREAVWLRDRGRCQWRGGVEPRCSGGLELSHRLPRQHCDEHTYWALFNVELLCVAHHRWVEANDRAAMLLGHRIGGAMVDGRLVGADASLPATRRFLRDLDALVQSL